MHFSRSLALWLLPLFGVLGTGCVSKPPKAVLPYAWPETPAASATAVPAKPTATLTTMEDRREDRVLEAFLAEPMPETIKRILAAELTHENIFSSVSLPGGTGAGKADFELGVIVEDVSWAVPHYERMLQTAFWTSFLTGGVGGVAYGSTNTPVFGRAAFTLTATRATDHRVVFQKRVEALHEEKMAKFSSDTLNTRLHMTSTALKKAMEQLRTDMTAKAADFAPMPEPPPASPAISPTSASAAESTETAASSPSQAGS
jgi:hypothetical protein